MRSGAKIPISGKGIWLFLIIVSSCLPLHAQIWDTAFVHIDADHNISLTEEGAGHLADIALSCIHREYPYKLGQVLRDPGDLHPPSVLHPSFYGCFDWHSSVHGHWMLVRLLKNFPELEMRDEIVEKIDHNLQAERIAGELAYYRQASPSFERTYGWAWLLQLALELESWDHPLGEKWAGNLQPLTDEIVSRYLDFLPKQDYPIRTGVHPNTAFGLSFALDYAAFTNERELYDLIVERALTYYHKDEECPIGWEPGGEDFLSPCLEEAALMARILPTREYDRWLQRFLPLLFERRPVEPAKVSERSDPKIVHLDGLNLSRAWDLYIISNAVSETYIKDYLKTLALKHLEATLPHVASSHYEGSHWLGSFAVYALTRN